jgi:hypothetical protein
MVVLLGRFVAPALRTVLYAMVGICCEPAMSGRRCDLAGGSGSGTAASDIFVVGFDGTMAERIRLGKNVCTLSTWHSKQCQLTNSGGIGDVALS